MCKSHRLLCNDQKFGLSVHAPTALDLANQLLGLKLISSTEHR